MIVDGVVMTRAELKERLAIMEDFVMDDGSLESQNSDDCALIH
jgi:hypothetical protein